MIRPQESIGSVPQPGVNPLTKQIPQQGPVLSPQEMSTLRNDPEIIQAVSQFVGKPVTLEKVPDNILVNIAGMIHKLGVQGAIQTFTSKLPPGAIEEIKKSF